MKLLIILAVIAFIAFAVNNIRRAKAAEKAKNAPKPRQDPFQTEAAPGGDPRKIDIADAVEIQGITYTARGVADYRKGPYTWTEIYLDDSSGRRRWLSVESDPDLELVLWEELIDGGLSPDGKVVSYGGRQYTRQESGDAVYASRGTTGLPGSGEMTYVDYQVGDYRLSFESYGGAQEEVGVGQVVHPGMVTVYPVGRTTS